MKRFLEWIGLKEKLHFIRFIKTPYVREGELWWASVGENVGSEINGKSKLFSRPVLVFKKFARDFYFVIPITTKNLSGSWYVDFKQGGQQMVACLHQSRSMDFRRFYSKLGELHRTDFERIELHLYNLYFSKKFPTISDGVVGKSQM